MTIKSATSSRNHTRGKRAPAAIRRSPVTIRAFFGLVTAVLGVGACNSGTPDASGIVEKVSAVVSTASLQLKVLTNTCGVNQTQDFFQVTNTGSTSVKLSDIKIKYWVNDTSGQSVIPHVSTGGCASGANGSPSCVHQVAGVTAASTSFSPTCGPDANHQANWEITIASTDAATLAPGAVWNNIQTAVNLANFSNFNPGTGKWFSPCVPGTSYLSDAHFALYYQGTLVFSNGIPAPDCRAPHGTQTITSYTPPPASPVVGPAPANQVLSVAVGLPVNNLSQLQAFANQVSDPTSANFRHFLSSADLIAQYSPSVASYNLVVAWAQSRFTKVGTFPNRLLVSITGTVAQIEPAFHANVVIATRPDGTQFYRLDRQPSVDVSVPLLGVSGVDNYVKPQHGGSTSPVAGSYGAGDLQKAFLAGPACTGLTGAGQSIGIFAYAGGFDPNDIALYRSRNSLAAGLPVQVLSGDDPTNPTPTPLAITGNEEAVELELDLESATAIAPGAQVIAFQGYNVDGILQLVANTPSVSQFSSSWMVGTTAMMPTTLTVMAAQGQTFLECSGDASAYLAPGTTTPTCSAADLAAGKISQIQYTPADFRSMPYVTVVGGTTLTTDTTQNYSSEVAWGGGAASGGWGSGGGVLTGTAIPSYQTGINAANSEVSAVYRNVPDVSLIGNNMYVVLSTCQAPGHGGITGQIDPSTGMPVPAACPAGSMKSGQDSGIGGTSVATPLWAGVMALINQKAKAGGLPPIGFANPTIYQIAKNPARYRYAFRDTTSGTVLNHCGLGYQTVAGYDLTTGWGTPQCGAVTAISGVPPVASVGVSTSAKGGALICVNGQNFTPAGTVTVQYLGVPELAGTSNPVQTVTTTMVVNGDGSFHEADNEIQTIASYVAAGAVGCPADGSGTVTVKVTDNASGTSLTSTIPARVFCKVDLGQPFEIGVGCWLPPATRPLFVSTGGLPPQLAEYGPVVCASGEGFTPSGAVDLLYTGVPLPNYVPQHRTATADASGKIKVDDGSTFVVYGDGVFCTVEQAFSNATVIATDLATGMSAKDTLDAELWCSVNYNPVSSGDLSGCNL